VRGGLGNHGGLEGVRRPNGEVVDTQQQDLCR
jgi:hypothetical protein